MNNYTHEHPQVNSLPRLLWAIGINTIMVLFEITLGVLTGSMALISDAIHNFSDISAMVLGYWSEKVSQKPVTTSKTYGYKKIEFITAFANSIILSVAILFVFYESIVRFFQPVVVESTIMFWVALVALVGNSIAALILAKSSQENFNMKAVWLHTLQDALLSLGVVIGAIIIYFTSWSIVDPILSIIIGIFITKEIYKIISHTINALLDSVPDDINFEEVKKEILKIKEVREVADLHIWQIDSYTKMLSTHIKSIDNTANQRIIESAKKMLQDKFGIEHTTLQIVACDSTLSNCNHCN